MTEELTVQKPGPLALAINPGAVLAHLKAVQEVIKTSLTPEEDYMRLPGTSKDSLLQPGAEKLVFAAQLTPAPRVEEINLGGEHRQYKVSGDLVNAEGRPVGSGHASCSTMESKYRWRYVSDPCPECHRTGSIMRSMFPKETPKDQRDWYCNEKKDGCGAKFPAATGEFKTHREENPDLADCWNTCEQMSMKRWLVSTATRTLAVSGMFSMDLEDMAPPAEPSNPAPTSAAARRKTAAKKTAAKKPGARKPPAPKSAHREREGNVPTGPPSPPTDAYEDEGYLVISTERAAEIGAKMDQLGLAPKFTMKAAPCNWDGELQQMPMKAGIRLLEHLNKLLKKAGKE